MNLLALYYWGKNGEQSCATPFKNVFQPHDN